MASSALILDAFTGMSAETGRALSGDAHLRQSIRDILTTPVGSRVMNRTYGSRLPELLGQPMNDALIADIVAEVADALDLWEPRVVVDRVVVRALAQGRINLDLVVTVSGERLTLEQVL